MSERTYTALFPFGGIGAGALGFLNARIRMLGVEARFESLGGIDFDNEACKDFLTLTGSQSLCADIATLTPERIREVYGPRAPDVVFMSPPCKGSSKLLSAALAATPKYEAMNKLSILWTEKMLLAWPTPPRLVLLENVPNITTRAKHVIDGVTRLLRAAGYAVHTGYHECGEIGGLAQKRKRFLLVARHQTSVPPLLYKPPKRRVRGCGEVLGLLPMPNDVVAGGAMHVMPKITWLNWIRLSIIPAGGDWRDIPGVLEEGQPRREVFRRHLVQDWKEPTGTIGGSGSNGPCAVADPRPGRFSHTDRVIAWDKPTHTITGSSRSPASGSPAVADVRVPYKSRAGAFGVMSWQAAAKTVRGSAQVNNAPISIADPRVPYAFDHGYGVLRFDEPSPTIAGGSAVGQGAYAVADPRPVEQEAFELPADPRKPPKGVPIIIAADGTWHRPLTTLELAALQGIPTMLNGKPLVLAGTKSSAHRERIGNAVPTPAGQAMAEQMLATLVGADVGTFVLSGGGTVWVEAPDALEPGSISMM